MRVIDRNQRQSGIDCDSQIASEYLQISYF
jgi:hypothetical protein